MTDTASGFFDFIQWSFKNIVPIQLLTGFGILYNFLQYITHLFNMSLYYIDQGLEKKVEVQVFPSPDIDLSMVE